MCKRWQGILKNPGHGSELWREVIIDFGHELITAVHTPIVWSDRRPSDEEFRCPALQLPFYTTSRVHQAMSTTAPVIVTQHAAVFLQYKVLDLSIRRNWPPKEEA